MEGGGRERKVGVVFSVWLTRSPGGRAGCERGSSLWIDFG